MSKLTDSLNKNLETVTRENDLVVKDDDKHPVGLHPDIEDDYEFSRSTFRDLVQKSSLAIDGMMSLAAESEHPRAYEVLSTMVKNTADVTDKLMSLQKAKKELALKSGINDQHNSVAINNNVYVGSTADLQRMLAEDEGEVIEHNQEQQ